MTISIALSASTRRLWTIFVFLIADQTRAAPCCWQSGHRGGGRSDFCTGIDSPQKPPGSGVAPDLRHPSLWREAPQRRAAGNAARCPRRSSRHYAGSRPPNGDRLDRRTRLSAVLLSRSAALRRCRSFPAVTLGWWDSPWQRACQGRSTAAARNPDRLEHNFSTLHLLDRRPLPVAGVDPPRDGADSRLTRQTLLFFSLLTD